MTEDKQKPGASDSRLADKTEPSSPIITRNISISGNARLYTLTDAGRAAIRAALIEQEEAADEHA